MTARLRPLMADLPAYTPGKTVPGAIKLASNETVQAPLPGVLEAIAAAAGSLNRYPDNGHAALKEHLARHLSAAGGAGEIGPEHLSIGCGSVSLCQQLVQITCSAGDEVVYGWRSFEVYPLQVQVAGALSVQVPLRDHAFDLDAMAAAITDRTRLIFICNPNNPTSTVVDPGELTRFVEAVPPEVLVVIDEAYVEYIRDGLLPDSLELARRHPNVVVLRTFSKAYGLAGLRVGYAVGDPEVITALGKVYVPFTVGTLTQAAAIASLGASAELLARTDAVVAERRRVGAAMAALGYDFPPSQANFLWLPLGGRTADFARLAAEAKVLVRPYGDAGARVTIGAPEENDAFLVFAGAWIGGGPAAS